MTKLLLVPLDDIVVFPQMNVTLTVDVGDADRVLLVPKREDEYAASGRSPASLTGSVSGRRDGRRDRGPPPGHRRRGGDRHQGRLLVDVEERQDGVPTDERTRELETEYRAVVEEILELRGDDGRIQAFLRSIADPGPLADTSGYSPDLSFDQKVQLLLETVDVTERLGSPSVSSASASRRCRSGSGSARTSMQGWRSSSGSTCCASRWTRSGRSSARTTRRSSRSTARRSRSPGCPRRCASRPTRSSRASSAWARARPNRR